MVDGRWLENQKKSQHLSDAERATRARWLSNILDFKIVWCHRNHTTLHFEM